MPLIPIDPNGPLAVIIGNVLAARAFAFGDSPPSPSNPSLLPVIDHSIAATVSQHLLGERRLEQWRRSNGYCRIEPAPMLPPMSGHREMVPPCHGGCHEQHQISSALAPIQTNWMRIPDIPSMITVARIPAATAPPIINRSASALLMPCAMMTDRAPAARCARTKNAPSQ
jgi:hypothetical protein